MSVATLEDRAQAFDAAWDVGAGTFQKLSNIVNNKLIELPLTYHQAENQCKTFYLLLMMAFCPSHVATQALD